MSDEINPEWATWFMGFLEGDGSFNITLNGSPECSIKLRNDDWRVLTDIKSRLGVGTLSLGSQQCARDKGKDAKDLITWNVYGPNCLRVLEILDEADSDKFFDHWLAGFMDAEGCFQITSNLSSVCSIELRNDDWKVLTNAQAKVGVGSLSLVSKQYLREAGGKSRDSIKWRVSGPKCLTVVNLLEGKMQTKKAVDFNIWAEAARFAASQKRGAPGKKEKMLEYKALMEDARKYMAPSEEELQAVLGKVKEGT